MADTYEIVTQRPRVDAQPGGLFVHVVDVTFRTKPNGVVGTVTVPETMYSADEIDMLVRAKAALLESVQQL